MGSLPSNRVKLQRQLPRQIYTDNVVAAAMRDQLVHHTEVLILDGEPYRPDRFPRPEIACFLSGYFS